MVVKKLEIANFTYELPTEKIAFAPLANRDDSKLLVYKNGEIIDEQFVKIANYLPEDSLLFLNNSKVIPARIVCKNSTGANIEIFCLEPTTTYTHALEEKKCSTWKCFIGNIKKWKEEYLYLSIENIDTTIRAKMIKNIGDAYIVELTWETNYSFAQLLDNIGKIPLPPYIKRESTNDDKTSYQTIYAKEQGSVAAPTAGLHFTEKVMKSIVAKNISIQSLTLHVGAGTFKPVKSSTLEGHSMHAEWIEVSKENIEALLQNKTVISIGTTSLRTLESIYWMGIKCCINPAIKIENLAIQQWEIYEVLQSQNISKQEALQALLTWLNTNHLHQFSITTQILIAPTYTFKIVDILITNFHQPQSTLLLLIAAAVGNNWKKIYEHALQNDYRFLSYGDSSILFLDKK